MQEEEESYIAKMRKLEDYLNSKAEKQDDEKSGKLSFEFTRHFSSSSSSSSSNASITDDSSTNTEASKGSSTSSGGVHRTSSSSNNSVQTVNNNNSKGDTGSSINDSSKPDVTKQLLQGVNSTSETSAAVGVTVDNSKVPAAATAAATAKRSKQPPRIQQQPMKVNVNDTGSRSSRKDRYEVCVQILALYCIAFNRARHYAKQSSTISFWFIHLFTEKLHYCYCASTEHSM
jgi:hypothetical protein